jgi:ribosome maturation factor RimP
LEAEVAQLFEDEGVVLLDLSAVWHGGRMQLRAIGDRRSGGLSIDDCVRLSRQIQHLIDEKRLVESDYRLEVSSPGLDYPLRHEWQFVKNIGRLLKITINGERGPRELSGRLRTVDAAGITLVGEKVVWKPAFAEILSAKVLPEFKSPPTEAKP